MTETPLDRIHIRDLRIQCIIGTLPHEREAKQEVVIDLTIEADLQRAGWSDRLDDTIDYKAIEESIVAMAEQSAFFLLERLAERAAEIALANPTVQRVRVLIEKPAALDAARAAAVEIFRSS